MRVVVVGGTGHIGRHLLPRLREAGHEPTVLTVRDPRDVARLLPVGTTVVNWDAPSASGLDRLLTGVSAVVDAISAGAAIARPAELPARLAASRAIVNALRRVPPSERPGVIVGFSRVDVYARAADSAADPPPVAGEDAEPGDTPAARAAARVEGTLAGAGDLAVRFVCLRLGSVVRPGLAGNAASALGSGGAGEWAAWIDVDDLARLVVRTITGWDLSGPVNAVAPRVLAAAPGLMRAPRPAWPAKALRAGFDFRHTSPTGGLPLPTVLPPTGAVRAR